MNTTTTHTSLLLIEALIEYDKLSIEADNKYVIVSKGHDLYDVVQKATGLFSSIKNLFRFGFRAKTTLIERITNLNNDFLTDLKSYTKESIKAALTTLRTKFTGVECQLFSVQFEALNRSCDTANKFPTNRTNRTQATKNSQNNGSSTAISPPPSSNVNYSNNSSQVVNTTEIKKTRMVRNFSVVMTPDPRCDSEHRKPNS